MINRLIKIIFSLPTIIALLLIIVINVRLIIVNQTDADLLKEIHGLKNSLNNGADIEMQKLYPEGYVFFNALYGLTWSNYIEKIDRDSPLFKEGSVEVQRSFDNINSETGRSTFESNLSLPCGAFYTGWGTYLLGKKLFAERNGVRDNTEIIQFKSNCDSIADVISKKIYPVSYAGLAWPADAVMCVASLSLHDKLFTPTYKHVIEGWISEVKKHLDKNGLIPHKVDPLKLTIIQQARGSSQSLMLAFLLDVDKEFAREQFTRYKEKFLDSRFGLDGIREYSADQYGLGDVDSGPVVLQMGVSATIVGLGVLSRYGEQGVANKLHCEIEALGFTQEKNDQKKYLVGMLPMADVFIAWSHSFEHATTIDRPSFVTIHLYSLLFSAMLMAVLWVLLKPARHKNKLHIPW